MNHPSQSRPVPLALKPLKLCFPEAILAQHLVVLGKTGKGKSSALRHMVEHLLAQGKRVCIVDPKGDWWGIKASADGKCAGFPVVLFGDFRKEGVADVPINGQSGRHVAELVAGGNRPCVIGFSGWHTSQMVKFWLEFAPALFKHNSGELFLVGDEFHNFAPKGKIMDPDAGRCLHWSNRLMSEGRGVGLVCLIASQRPQKVHNDALTCCETLVALGVNHPADRNAVKDWIDGCGDVARGRVVLDSLAGLPRGEAYVWSPEINYGPERIKFPMFVSFDSFAPPQLQKRVITSGWADVNLDDVKAKLAAVIEEAKGNDPRELRKQIAELKKQLNHKDEEFNRKERIELKEVIKEVPVLGKEELELLKKWDSRLGDISSESNALVIAIAELTGRVNAKVFAAPERAGRQGNVRQGNGIGKSFVRNAQKFTGDGQRPHAERFQGARGTASLPGNHGAGAGLGKCERTLLSVLAQFPEGCNRKKLILLGGYCWSGSTQNALGRLRGLNLIEGENSGVMMITPAGEACGPFDALPEGRALLDFWVNFRQFGLCERTLLRVLSEHPEGLNREQLLKLSGYEWSGSTQNALGALRTAEVVTGRNNEVMRLSDELLQAVNQ